MPKIVSEEKAKQGRWGGQVLIVLVVGLILAFVVWGLVEIYGEAIDPAEGTTSQALPPVIAVA